MFRFHKILPLYLIFILNFSQALASASQDENAIYKLAPFDTLSISVYGQGDLSSEQRVTDIGTVSIPLLGEITVGDMTVSQAQKAIETAFIEQRYLVKPVVTISITEFSSKVITILGEVGSPGSIAIPTGRNTLPIQIAIAQAGGFTTASAKGDVKVTRKKAGGKEVSEVVNVSAILDSSAGETYLIHTDDIIFVPRRLF